MEITFELDTSPIGKLPAKWEKAKSQGLFYNAQDMTRFLIENSPVDHGVLRQWSITDRTDDQVTIKTPAKYALFVDQGTKAHWIEPKNKKALHWEGTGSMYAGGLMRSYGYGGFSKGHMVGGIQARNFVQKSFEQLQPLVMGNFMKALEEQQ